MVRRKIFEQAIAAHLEAVAGLSTLMPELFTLSIKIETALQAGGRIFFCGNGGSAADAQHLAAEFTGRFQRERAPLPGLALHCDTSALTAIGNDYSFDEIYARPLEAYGRSGDVILGISTSGRSKNILKALEVGQKKGLFTALLTGKNVSKPYFCDLILAVPSTETPRIQEMHIILGHILCELVDNICCGNRCND